mmetsp:Transcript_146964/g.409370  ORF Transcript_146964/g.409370 Transcript_146964/m.409370 type:complete len:277 (-) Transcript_146964:622-1452(-)
MHDTTPVEKLQRLQQVPLHKSYRLLGQARAIRRNEIEEVATTATLHDQGHCIWLPENLVELDDVRVLEGLVHPDLALPVVMPEKVAHISWQKLRHHDPLRGQHRVVASAGTLARSAAPHEAEAALPQRIVADDRVGIFKRPGLGVSDSTLVAAGRLGLGGHLPPLSLHRRCTGQRNSGVFPRTWGAGCERLARSRRRCITECGAALLQQSGAGDLVQTQRQGTDTQFAHQLWRGFLLGAVAVDHRQAALSPLQTQREDAQLAGHQRRCRALHLVGL